jgi:hypothetical protein
MKIEVGSRRSLQSGNLLARGLEQELIHARVALRRPHAVGAGYGMDQLQFQALLPRKLRGPFEHGFSALISVYGAQRALPAARRV